MYTLAILITTIIMLFTASSYVKMVKAYPIAGSAYTYVNKSANPHMGFMTGWVKEFAWMRFADQLFQSIGWEAPMVMTPEAAMQFRWEEEMGSLEVGKLANMVLHPRIVIFDGNVISGSSLWYNGSILTIS